MIAVQGNTFGTVVTIVNWDLYQKELIQGNTKVTLGKHLLGTNKKNKEEIRKGYTDNFEKLYKIYPNPKNKAQTYNSYKKLLKKHTHDELFNASSLYSSC